jgi:selenocysteine lyase/cysteine desulfurase
MASVRLPDIDTDELGRRLFEKYRIEVPLVCWQDAPPVIRVSFQAYNDQQDADRLVEALAIELPDLMHKTKQNS